MSLTDTYKPLHQQLVLVVGGFGRNDYLYRRIEEYCQGRGIQARRPGFP